MARKFEQRKTVADRAMWIFRGTRQMDAATVRALARAGTMIRRVCMLLLAAAMAAGCAGHDKPARETITSELAAMSQQASAKVSDGQRAARLQQAIEGLKTELIAFHEAYEDFAVRIRALNADPVASREQFNALLDRFDAGNKDIRGRILERHFDLIALTTPEEWKALAPHERKAVVAAGN